MSGARITEPDLCLEVLVEVPVYKQLEPGKTTSCYGWEGVEAAGVLVAQAQSRYEAART